MFEVNFTEISEDEVYALGEAFAINFVGDRLSCDEIIALVKRELNK